MESSSNLQQNPNDLWLVRTHLLKIFGPYSRQELKDLVVKRELSSQDEVCRSGNYWFSLGDLDEVKKNLGLDIRLEGPADNEEDTQTGTETEVKEERIILPPVSSNSSPQLRSSKNDQSDGATTMFSPSMSLKRETPMTTLSPKQSETANKTKIHEPFTVGHIEKPSLWKGFVLVLALILAGLLFLLFKTTSGPPLKF